MIGRDHLQPEGAFAQAQAEFLDPDRATVAQLDRLLAEKNAGIVAHFYMDAELQGVLTACLWPHLHISDSLLMADRAVTMAQQGVRTVLVAGVDFMSENVRAVLDAAGFALGGPQPVQVLRLDQRPIGCSLAQAAEAPAYAAFLQQSRTVPHSLHVIYINTSLVVKALSEQELPTITCTSSNVLQTMLQAAAQLLDVHIWYGPDTYMGNNIEVLLDNMAQMTVAEVQAIHPAHTPATVAALHGRLHCFAQGACVVHQLFGAQVVEKVRQFHADALLTAHLEVPGEMFALALQAQAQGRGAVGSTSNILDFIMQALGVALEQTGPQTVKVVLGTESGMVTSVVRAVQGLLRQHARTDVALELIFPVAADAVTVAGDSPLGIVPGPASGEGCSVGGGCATCPYMKMNRLDGLVELLQVVGERDLQPWYPHPTLGSLTIEELMSWGTRPILAMRHLQRTGQLSAELVAAVTQGRFAGRARDEANSASRNET